MKGPKLFVFPLFSARPPSAQRADVFTKALPPEAHIEMTQHILGEIYSPYYDNCRAAYAPPAA